MKNKRWTINVDGENHQVTCKLAAFMGSDVLEVDGQAIEIKKKKFAWLTGVDQAVNIAGKECRFVLIGSKADIAVDGVYLDSKKEYNPLKPMPIWGWVFIVACALIPVVALGGMLPMLFGLLGMIYCARSAVSPYLKTWQRVMICFGITFVAWVLFLSLLFVSILLQM